MQRYVTFIILIFVGWQQDCVTATGKLHFKHGAPHVQLNNGGVVSGSVKLSRDGRPYSEFKGVQYGVVPGRFQEAQPLERPTWQGVLPALKAGAVCAQKTFGEIHEYMGDEDCLFVNVYVPMSTKGHGEKGYPVMVWIHGGAFIVGSGSEYNPKYFMDEDVIVVTLNYRLGVFGFLSTEDHVVPGNNGMKDMVLALRWVQDNIGQFNGNKNLVTIFGESAGSASVSYLLLSPTTKGLFHRAISQSASALNPWAYAPKARENAVELATFLKCPTAAAEASDISSQEILSCLKGLPAQELNKAEFQFKVSFPEHLRNFFFAPTTEPPQKVSSLTPFLSEPPISLVSRKDSRLTEVPWMIGATEDEGATMYAGPVVANVDRLKSINENWDVVAPMTFDYGKYVPIEKQAQLGEKMKQFYFGNKEISKETRAQLSDVYSDEMFLHGIYKSAMEAASRNSENPVYIYQYAYKGPVSVFLPYYAYDKEEQEKVGHGDDIQHQFIFEDETQPLYSSSNEIIKPGTPDEEFSKNFVKLWVSFAIHGKPTHSWGNLSKPWNSITKEEAESGNLLRWYRIDANPTFLEVGETVKHRLQFWDTVWKDYLSPGVIAKYKSSLARGNGKTEL